MEPTQQQGQARYFIIAWALGLVFYFLDYVTRSAPAVMLPELEQAFGVTTLGLVVIIGTYYYTYSTVSLVAGISFDRLGAKYSLLAGTVVLGLGCLLFYFPNQGAGYAGRLLQGMGCAFAFPGCVYLASRGFSAGSLATAIGFTQCVGMLGGSAGQFVVGPWLRNGLHANLFWLGTGLVTLVVGVVLFLVTPSVKNDAAKKVPSGGLLSPYKTVFSNPQSYLCGLIAGLLFAPTTIFAMTWGVDFFQQDRQLSFQAATLACAMVPMGWVFGCPLLGWLADRGGRRKPVLAGGAIVMLLSLAQLLFLPALVPTYISTFVLGVASGAAMIPYSVIKEANPDEVKGSATGAINFLTFGVTTILSPLFSRYFGKTLATTANHAAHFRAAGLFWIGGIALAIVVTFALRETGLGRKAAI
jgi:MFS family permease